MTSGGGAVDDYYDIVGVDRTASRELIDHAIRDQLRRWQQRTASADLDRRQDAERRLRQLSEARTTLLDDEKRRHYDRQLPGERESAPQVVDDDATRLRRLRFGTLPEPVLPTDWIEELDPDTEFEPPEGRLGYPYAD